jgi:hypothetical protein
MWSWLVLLFLFFKNHKHFNTLIFSSNFDTFASCERFELDSWLQRSENKNRIVSSLSRHRTSFAIMISQIRISRSTRTLRFNLNSSQFEFHSKKTFRVELNSTIREDKIFKISTQTRDRKDVRFFARERHFRETQTFREEFENNCESVSKNSFFNLIEKISNNSTIRDFIESHFVVFRVNRDRLQVRQKAARLRVEITKLDRQKMFDLNLNFFVKNSKTNRQNALFIQINTRFDVLSSSFNDTKSRFFSLIARYFIINFEYFKQIMKTNFSSKNIILCRSSTRRLNNKSSISISKMSKHCKFKSKKKMSWRKTFAKY